MAKITLEDWYDLCEEFKEDTSTSLSWACGFMGWDYDDAEAIKINRDFLKRLNQLLAEKEKQGGEDV